MPFASQPSPKALASLASAAPRPFWLDDPDRPEPAPALIGDTQADLLVVGAGFSGLWTALLAKEADPGRDIVLVEGDETAQGASGRNGGFVAASLTHGFENGLSRWPTELKTLVALGQENLEAIARAVETYHIDCDFLRSGELVVATEEYQVEGLQELARQAAAYGEQLDWLEAATLRRLVNSPTYLGGVYNRRGVAMVNPARLAWGLRRACLERGVRLYERTPVQALQSEPACVHAQTPYGSLRAQQVALATNAFPPLLKRLAYYIVPVYDYVLMSEPLGAVQRAALGWQERQGISDSANQFHYYRMTADGRILWGGYDAVYYANNGFGGTFESSPHTFGRLAEHFFQTFPQLEGLRFSHAWGGAIDTCSRFNAFWGTTHGGRTAYVAGFTGLGVGASRFGAQVLLDLLAKADNPRTHLKMVRSKPVPFPPEPLRSAVINLTRRALDQADRRQGQRNVWLKLLDALGLGFDS